MRRTALAFAALVAVSAAAAPPPAAVVTTIAGAPAIPGFADGAGADARFTHPTWLDVLAKQGADPIDPGQPGEIFVVDRINQVLRRISPDGVVKTIDNVFPASGWYPKSVDFGSAFGGGIMVEPPDAGCGSSVYQRGMWVTSSGLHQLLLLNLSGSFASRDGLIWVGAGVPGSADVDWSASQFDTPVSMAHSPEYGRDWGAVYTRWFLYVADSGNHTIRKISYGLSFEACPQPRYVTTLAGAAGKSGIADGNGSAARFNTPRGLAVARDGSLYVSDAGNHTIRKVTPDGVVTTVAGVPGVAGSDDAHLNTPSGIDVNEKGELFIVDTFNHAIRKLTTDGQLVTVAGQLGVSGFADGDGKTALFNAPVGLKIAPDGTLVVADTGNNVIRRVTLAP